jgi:hypothetical protein
MCKQFETYYVDQHKVSEGKHILPETTMVGYYAKENFEETKKLSHTGTVFSC